ncbi:MAG: DNA-directed RNA polymerase subunit beta' [Erythrobacter sp.]|nr:DNA-directed RNA polymerase subunit beta' [Erythrobacter sp.]
MTQGRSSSATSAATISKLAAPPRLDELDPIAARFVQSIRLIALHEKAKRDPIPELALRLGNVEVAFKSLVLSQTICGVWPENIHVSRHCCRLMSHDEATIGAMVQSAAACDRAGFEAAIEGLIRPERVHRLWDAVLGLIAAEARAL